MSPQILNRILYIINLKSFKHNPNRGEGATALFIAVGSPRQALWLVVSFQKFMGRFLIVSALLMDTESVDSPCANYVCKLVKVMSKNGYRIEDSFTGLS